MIQIRQAKGKDVSAIANLYRQLVSPVAPEVEVNVTARRIGEIHADPHNFLFVMEIDDLIYGSAFITLCLDPMHGNQPYAILENFVIDERQQGKRFGAALMQYIEEFCLQADCSKIMLLSNSKRSEAHRFFEKQGFSSVLKKGFVKYRSQLRSN